MAEPFPQHMNPVDQAPTLFRVLHLGYNGKQDWHGIRRCPHTAGIELVAVEDADHFSSRSQAENFRKQYEHLHGGSRTVIREVTFAVGEALPKLAAFVAPFREPNTTDSSLSFSLMANRNAGRHDRPPAKDYLVLHQINLTDGSQLLPMHIVGATDVSGAFLSLRLNLAAHGVMLARPELLKGPCRPTRLWIDLLPSDRIFRVKVVDETAYVPEPDQDLKLISGFYDDEDDEQEGDEYGGIMHDDPRQFAYSTELIIRRIQDGVDVDQYLAELDIDQILEVRANG